jgi:hypothetical protein
MAANQNSSKTWLYVLLIIIVLYAVFKDKKTTPEVDNPQKSKISSISAADSIKRKEELAKQEAQKKQEVEEQAKQEKVANKKRKYNEEKQRIIGCLIGSFKGSWGTYTFYSNGFFSWEVNSGPYQQYREGKWKYVGGNKVKVYKTWIGKSATITVSKYCEVFGLN